MARWLGLEYGTANPTGAPSTDSVLVLNSATGQLWAPNNGAWVNIVGGANGVTTNGSSAPSVLDSSGTPTSSTTVPSTTPVVSALPTSGPLLVIGQYVIFQGKPYIYTAFPGGSDYWALDTTGSPSISDTQANLSLYPAASHPVGTVFHATDWNISYAVQNVGGTLTWVYYNGIYEATLATIQSKIASLGPAEYRLIARASDYLHNWFWTGSAFSLTEAAKIGFAGGLFPGSTLVSVGGPPFGGGSQLWQLCDGSTVDVSQEDASVVATAVPTIANTWFVR